MSGKQHEFRRGASKVPSLEAIHAVLKDTSERVQNDPASITSAEVLAACKHAISVLEPIHKTLKKQLEIVNELHSEDV